MKTTQDIQDWCNEQWKKNRVDGHCDGVAMQALVPHLLEQHKASRRQICNLATRIDRLEGAKSPDKHPRTILCPGCKRYQVVVGGTCTKCGWA